MGTGILGVSEVNGLQESQGSMRRWGAGISGAVRG